MKKILILISVSMFIFSLFSAPVQANETETTNEMVKYALIVSLAPSINNALAEIYKDASKGVPQWGGWETEIVNIKQLTGVGGIYEVTVRVHSYYEAHTGNGIDEITIRIAHDGQEVTDFKHIQDV
ncbi:DUF3888 domain-containing protein [Bacillus sp. S13(2024)]|uniref:DUF3888 domain-containing protein n=1 Tax=unclassified Bacillus (in: firmicutes) TaxID=185979 RepID=UPI003D1C6C35